MKKYTIDFKQLLKEANWQHEDFAAVARFFGGKQWEEHEWGDDVIKEITK